MRRCSAWAVPRHLSRAAYHDPAGPSCARANARGCGTPTSRRSRSQATQVQSLPQRVLRRPPVARTLDRAMNRVCTAACGRAGRGTKPQTTPGRRSTAQRTSVRRSHTSPRSSQPRRGEPRSRQGERGWGGDQAWLGGRAFRRTNYFRIEPRGRRSAGPLTARSTPNLSASLHARKRTRPLQPVATLCWNRAGSEWLVSLLLPTIRARLAGRTLDLWTCQTRCVRISSPSRA